MQSLNYGCSKCSNNRYETGEIGAAGGFWSKIFDVQGSRFIVVTRSRCRYTEFFKAKTSMPDNIFNFFTN
ncbi:MAG: GTP-binding protein [Candidatus Zixiibacteriota bacterium]|nr:MAG: GTP-binding protein [candidate division Zixibacteria bacterium]